MKITEMSAIGLGALVALGEGDRKTVGEIAAEIKRSRHFVSKVLQQLCKRRLVVSYKGFEGGYELKRAAEEITMLDALQATEGNLDLLPTNGFTDEDVVP